MNLEIMCWYRDHLDQTHRGVVRAWFPTGAVVENLVTSRVCCVDLGRVCLAPVAPKEW